MNGVLYNSIIKERHLFNTLKILVSRKIIPIIDLIVPNDKDVYLKRQLSLIYEYPNRYFSIKTSSVNNCHNSLLDIVKTANKYNSKIIIDAEDFNIQDTIELLSNSIIVDNHYKIYKTYQMYRTDSMDKLLMDIEEFKRMGIVHNIKVVRGGYIDTDKKYNIIYNSKEKTDRNYNDAVKMLLKLSNRNPNINVIFGTHNIESFKLIKNNENKNCFHASYIDKQDQFNNNKINRMIHIPVIGGGAEPSYNELYLFRKNNEYDIFC